MLAEPIPELYIAEELWPDLSPSLALREGGEPNLRVPVPNQVCPFGDAGSSGHGPVGDAVPAADLLEAAEPRAVAAGAARLGELLATGTVPRMTAVIELLALPPPVDQLWHTLIDLDDQLDVPCALIGGQMVLLHAIEHGHLPPQISQGGDVIADIRAVPGALITL